MTPKESERYRRTLQTIPWATQTNAKRLLPACSEAMPAFIQRAEGCRLWDSDGREYIDFRCALGPVILGYRHPRVESAVQRQMQAGVLFSMASPVELETAEVVRASVPWLEQVRFMKTGADACSACVRLARASTGRDHMLTCGYHGYHDWFVTSWPDNGVPRVLQPLVHEVAYGDLAGVERVFEQHGQELAAAIVEPYQWPGKPDPEFLSLLRRKCDESGTVLIFDEVLTGFRLARGGATEYFGVVPDLAAFAKALANGYPLAAFGGKKRFMQQLEKTVITTTYGGETLSLAAAHATLTVMQEEPVHAHVFEVGARLRAGFEEIARDGPVAMVIGGVPPAPTFHFEDDGDAKLLHRCWSRLFESGIFPNDPWFISYAHQPSDIDRTLEAVRQAVRGL